LIKRIANIFIKIHKKGRVLGGLISENIDIKMESIQELGSKIQDLKVKNFDDSYYYKDRETIYKRSIESKVTLPPEVVKNFNFCY